jgi:hypothetical protein
LNDNNFVSEAIGAERVEKLVSGSGAVSGTFEKGEEWERSAERAIGERERSGEWKSKKLVECVIILAVLAK